MSTTTKDGKWRMAVGTGGRGSAKEAMRASIGSIQNMAARRGHVVSVSTRTGTDDDPRCALIYASGRLIYEIRVHVEDDHAMIIGDFIEEAMRELGLGDVYDAAIAARREAMGQA